MIGSQLRLTFTFGFLGILLALPSYSAELFEGENLSSLAEQYSRSISSFPKPVIFSQLLSQAVLPSQKVDSLDPIIDDDFFHRYRLKGEWKIRKFFVSTPDNKKLETIEIYPPQFDSNNPRFVIAFNGNGMTYPAYLDQLTKYGKKLGVATIGFNYRGVGKSTSHPRNFHELILDGITQTERVLNLGVRPENITLDGHSLGGAIGAYVAAFFHDKGLKLKFFSDRSFATLERVVKTKFPKFISGALFPLLPNAGWNLRPIEAFNSIENEYKAYVCCTDDKVIDVNASLASALSEDEQCLGSTATGGHMFEKDWLVLNGQDDLKVKKTALDLFFELVNRKID